MLDKYIIFSPYRSGLCNVIMSYEIAVAIAYATKRTLIIPPTVYLTHITQGAKEQCTNFWSIFDKTNNSFDTIEIGDHDFPAQLGDFHSWSAGADQLLQDCYSPAQIPQNAALSDEDFCVVGQNHDSDDFYTFLSGRKIINLDRPEKYILLENNLFQHYWYWVYVGDSAQRNFVKNKINRLFRYAQRYYDMVAKEVIVGAYNAIHVRRGDFFYQYGYNLQTVDDENKLFNQVSKLVDPTLPLYIATDEPNQDFFKPLTTRYRVMFLNSFFKNLTKLEAAIVEQIICSQAEQFLGTVPSTYSKRINVMRGLEGKPATDYTGINQITSWDPRMSDPIPWKNSRWGWSMSSHPQWMQE